MQTRSLGLGFPRKTLVKDGKATAQIEDGNGKVLKKQKIEYTDFPLDAVVLYCCPQDDQFVILLPSEY